MASSSNKFLRLSNAGFQMAIVIGGMAFLGNYLDDKYKNDNQLYTVILSLLGVALGIYIMIKEVINLTKDKNGNGSK
jgi:F0F1-type ATP synthase assembly protein I